MKESEYFSKNESDRELLPISESRAIQPPEQLLTGLALITDELRSVLNKADDYILALDKLLADKLTPTEDVAELRERLHEARSNITEVKEDFREIEGFLTSATMEYLPENIESSSRATKKEE